MIRLDVADISFCRVKCSASESGRSVSKVARPMHPSRLAMTPERKSRAQSEIVRRTGEKRRLPLCLAPYSSTQLRILLMQTQSCQEGPIAHDPDKVQGLKLSSKGIRSEPCMHRIELVERDKSVLQVVRAL